MIDTYSFGGLFICRFPFTSGAFSKPRPVLVLFDLEADAVLCRVASSIHATDCDVSIRDWREAGLEKPSVARLNRLVTAEKSLLSRRLGRVSPFDADAVRSAWNRRMIL